MATDSIPTRSTGQTILDEFFNVLKRVLGTDFVPRNTSGVATEIAGRLGSPTFPWKTAHIAVGYFFAGQIIPFHSYNGTLSPGHGWMKCDGRQITESNYDAEFGAGSWATYIGASDIENKYLPNLSSKYLTGTASTTQDGSAAITSVGNAGNVSDLSHTHTVNSHRHKWADGTTGPGTTFNSAGTQINYPSGTSGSGNIGLPGGSGSMNGAAFTDNQSPGTSSSLSSANIRPESIEVIFYMRII